MDERKARLVEVAIISIALMYIAAAIQGINGMLFTAATNAVLGLVAIAFGIKLLKGDYGKKE